MNDDVNMYIVGSSTYYEKTIPILNEIVGRAKKICYVTLNQPYSGIKMLFSENRLEIDKFIFIDGVTKRIQIPPKIEGVIFLDAPFVLDDLFFVANKIISEGQISHMIFDNLMQPAIGSSQDEVARFILRISRKAKDHGIFAAFLFPYEEIGSRLVEKIELIYEKDASQTNSPS